MKYIDQGNRPNQQARILRYLAKSYLRSGKFDEGLEMFLKAQNILENTSYTIEKIWNLNDIGIFHFQRSEFSQAEACFLEAYDQICVLNLNRNIKGSVTQNIGMIYLEENRNDEALEYLEKSLAIWKHLNIPLERANTLAGLGHAYLGLNDVEKGQEYYKQAGGNLRSI